MLYRVTLSCPYYVNPGESKRDNIPANTEVDIIGTSGEWSQISGKDPNPWRGKWVRSFYLELVVDNTTPEPPPDIPAEPEPDPYLIVERPDGTRWAYVLAPEGYPPVTPAYMTVLRRFGQWVQGKLSDGAN